jgi:hypothetical protein
MRRWISTMANIGRLLSEGVILLLVMALEYFTILPAFGSLVGWGLLGVTGIILGFVVLRNIL